MADCNRIAARSFINGIDDINLQQRCASHESEGLEKLLEIVENVQSWFRPTGATEIEPKRERETNYKADVGSICAFCQASGHAMATCPLWLKRNPDKVMAVTQEKCKHCSRPGHTELDCRKRISRLYCPFCRLQGHESTIYCEKAANMYTRSGQGRDQGSTRTRNQQQYSSRRPRQQQNSNQGRQRSPSGPRGQIVCYGCNEVGHIRPECPNVQHSENSQRADLSQ